MDSVESKVDLLISSKESVDVKSVPAKKKPKGRLGNRLFIGCGFLVIGFLLFSLVIPGFFKDYLFESSETGQKSGVLDPLSDDDGPAYDYWYAPENSFGIESTKTVNWSHFKSLFNSHTDWSLEYKRYSYSDWAPGNQYLSVSKYWNESGFWKINLTLTVPVEVYRIRFTFGCNLSVLNYVERSGSEVWINYTANQSGETYSVSFNWSDLLGIPNLVFTKGVSGGLFWFRLLKDSPTQPGAYVFDPTFGNNQQSSSTTIHTSTGSCYMKGSAGMPVNGDGTVDNITVDFGTLESTEYYRCALYEYVDNSTDFAGDCIGTTDVVEVTTAMASTSVVFPFSSKPSVVNNTNYYLLVTQTTESDADATNNIRRKGIITGAFYISKSGTDPLSFDSPLTGEAKITNYYITIYASYTVSEGGEVRLSTQIFNKYFVCANTSYRSNLKVFDKYFVCGNTSSRVNKQVFDKWFLCVNTSYRSSTQVFDKWFLCGNVTEPEVRNSYQVFDKFFVCGNSSGRVSTQLFDKYFVCGNTSYRSSKQLFDKWFLCGNTSYRSSKQVFDKWFLCSNITEPEVRNTKQVFDKWFLCGNGTTRVSNKVFDKWFLCGNTSIPSVGNLTIVIIYPLNNSINNFVGNLSFNITGTGTIFYNVTVSNGLIFSGNGSSGLFVEDFIYYISNGNYTVWINASDSSGSNTSIALFSVVGVESMDVSFELGMGLLIFIVLCLIVYLIHKISYQFVGIHVPLGIAFMLIVLFNMNTIDAWFTGSQLAFVIIGIMVMIYGGYKDLKGLTESRK